MSFLNRIKGMFKKEQVYNIQLEFPVVVNAKSEKVYYDTKIPYDVRNRVMVKNIE